MYPYNDVMELANRPIGHDIQPFRTDRTHLSRHVAAYLRDLIMSGQFPSGERMRLKALSSRLGVSTTPVREALLLLETEGLVEGELHRGFQVKQLSPEDVLDIFEMHAFIAGKLAERAATRCHEAILTELTDIDERIKKAASERDAGEVEDRNYQFHRLINQSADSPMLTRFLLQTTRYVPRYFYARIPGWIEASASEHGPILEALRDQDGQRAREVTEDHIRRAGNLLVVYLTSTGLLRDTAIRSP